MNEAVLDVPQASASPPQKPLITPLNAREYQLRAAQARVHNRLARKVAESIPPLAVINEPRIALVERELARVSKMMADEKDVDSYQKLSAARARLFTEWQVLSGTPNPGSAKSRVKRSTGHSVEPLTMSDTQIAPVAPIPSNAETVTVNKTELAKMIAEAVAAALAGKTVTG